MWHSTRLGIFRRGRNLDLGLVDEAVLDLSAQVVEVLPPHSLQVLLPLLHPLLHFRVLHLRQVDLFLNNDVLRL